MLQRFQNKVVIVTGGASGIGEATARRFSDEGAAVVLADRDQANLDRVAAELPRERSLARLTDVSKYEQVEALVAAAIEAFGALHVLVNNAGIAVTGKITERTPAQWDKVMAVNAGGVFNGCRAAMPHL
ncbi:MAG: SDR family NAD(P)-dependent oxidoreductase, partial [bacterium]